VAYERLVKKMTVENLWMYILSSLKNEPKYGYEIRKYVKEKYGFNSGRVTAYVVLYRLEKEGHIRLKEEKKDALGPPRKYYEITKKGLRTLEDGERFLENILKRIRARSSE